MVITDRLNPRKKEEHNWNVKQKKQRKLAVSAASQPHKAQRIEKHRQKAVISNKIF